MDGLSAEIEATPSYSKQISHSDIDLKIMAPEMDQEADQLMDQPEDTKTSCLRNRAVQCSIGLLCVGCVSAVAFAIIKDKAIGEERAVDLSDNQFVTLMNLNQEADKKAAAPTAAEKEFQKSFWINVVKGFWG